MKKSILVAAFALAASIAQAATVSWTCTNVYKDSENKSTGIAYLMLESDVADFSALKGKGATAINAALEKALYSYTPSTAGAYGVTGLTNSQLGLEDAADYGNAYLVIFDTATVTDTSKFYVTSSKELSTQAGDYEAKMLFASQATASKQAANWGSVAAPEPTSGILLLLGMAGLALKRKRA